MLGFCFAVVMLAGNASVASPNPKSLAIPADEMALRGANWSNNSAANSSPNARRPKTSWPRWAGSLARS